MEVLKMYRLLVYCLLSWKKCVYFLQIWQKVKNANPSMSVCEVGSTIGKMWREMGDVEKQKYNDEFLADKVSILLPFTSTLSCAFFV